MKLRDEVEKKGQSAKAAAGRKASSAELCTLIGAYSAAESRWVKYAEANVASCQIPAEIVQKLKELNANTRQTTQKVCNHAHLP